MEHDLLRITLHGVLRHPGLLFQPVRGSGGAMGWYGRVRDASMDRIQADFFARRPEGLAETPEFKIYLQRARHILSASVITSGRYEPRTSELVRRLLRPDSTFVDVGANLGWFSLLAAPRARSVWAFEPHPTNFGLLQRSIAANGCTNVNARQEALGSADGETTLWLSEYSAGWHSTTWQVGSNKIPVPCRRLDSVFPDGRISLMKIDVEGGEPDVLAGAPTLISSGRLEAVVMEWNPDVWPQRMELLQPFEAFRIDGKTPFRWERRPPERNVLLRNRTPPPASP